MTAGALVKGIGLGLGAAVPIGPVNVEIIRRCLRVGALGGFALGCGAVTVDVTYAVLTSLGIRPLLGHPAWLAALGFAGSALLLYLGVMSLRSALRKAGERQKIESVSSNGASATRAHVHYTTGLAMTCLNPMTLLFWFIAVPAVVGQVTADPRRDLPIVCAGVFLGALAWVIFLTSSLHVLRRRLLTGRGVGAWMQVADIGGGLLLIGFALGTLVRAARF